MRVGGLAGVGDQLMEKLGFGVIGMILDAGGALEAPELLVQIVLGTFAGVRVPVRPDFPAAADGQKAEKIILSFQAQKIHVQACFQLMPDVAVYIEPGHQQIMDTLEKRIVDHPPGFGHLTDKSIDHAGAVEMSEHRQEGVGIDAVTVPDITDVIADIVRIEFHQIFFLGDQVFFLEFGIMMPGTQQSQGAFALRRDAQQIADLA